MPMLDFVDGVLRTIENGGKNGGEKVLKNYIDCCQSGTKPTKKTEIFVLGCLSKIVECYYSGIVPNYDDIFCLGQKLNKTKGRHPLPDRVHLSREVKLGVKVDKLISDGLSRADAIEQVRIAEAMSFKNVEKYYDRWSSEK